MTGQPPADPGPPSGELHDRYGPEARYAVAAEAALPDAGWQREVARGLELGLPAADSIKDRRIPTFARGELPLRGDQHIPQGTVRRGRADLRGL
jgi:agmatinase